MGTEGLHKIIDTPPRALSGRLWAEGLAPDRYFVVGLIFFVALQVVNHRLRRYHITILSILDIV